MHKIKLIPMTLSMARDYFSGFSYDSDVFIDKKIIKQFSYDPQAVEVYCRKQQQLKRIHMAIIIEKRIVGELIFKNIDTEQSTCELSIHLQNDSVKNKGYGSEAERLALQYAFRELKMNCIFANALVHNTRSMHVLEKVGFQKIDQDSQFCYYQYCKADYDIKSNPSL